jgi:8-oxo-dGTP diphosphatase
MKNASNKSSGKQPTEADYIAEYRATDFDRPNTSVDTVIFTVIDNYLHVLTIKRSEHPFKDTWSLVGGYIDTKSDPDLETTAKRKLLEKTGVSTPYLEQFGAVGNLSRDPRGWSVTTVYFALIPNNDIQLQAGSSASEIKWSKVIEGRVEDELAFDHAELLFQCMERLRSKVLYTSLPVHLLQKDFTLGELQKIYEVILGASIDHKSFRRRMLSSEILADSNKMRHEGKRPAKLYHLKESHRAHYFSRNIGK